MVVEPREQRRASALRRRVALVVLALVAAPALMPAAAGAHSGGNKVPVIAATIRESGPLQALVEVRLRDEAGGEALRGAKVRGVATMTTPNFTSPFGKVTQGKIDPNFMPTAPPK
jgi:hypothetical protein